MTSTRKAPITTTFCLVLVGVTIVLTGVAHARMQGSPASRHTIAVHYTSTTVLTATNS